MSMNSRVKRLETQSGGNFKVEILAEYFDECGLPIDDDDNLDQARSILVDGEHVFRKPDESICNFELRACSLKARDSRQHVVLARSIRLL